MPNLFFKLLEYFLDKFFSKATPLHIAEQKKVDMSNINTVIIVLIYGLNQEKSNLTLEMS